MPQIDLILAAELLVVLLLVATMDATPPGIKAAEPALEEPELPVQWTAETDLLPNASCGWRSVGSFDVTHCAIAADLLS